MKDFYHILSVSVDASPLEIKKRFRFLSQAFHPDKFAKSNEELKSEAEVMFKEINAAYQVLSDPIKRSDYDSKRPSGYSNPGSSRSYSWEQQNKAEHLKRESLEKELQQVVKENEKLQKEKREEQIKRKAIETEILNLKTEIEKLKKEKIGIRNYWQQQVDAARKKGEDKDLELQRINLEVEQLKKTNLDIQEHLRNLLEIERQQKSELVLKLQKRNFLHMLYENVEFIVSHNLRISLVLGVVGLCIVGLIVILILNAQSSIQPISVTENDTLPNQAPLISVKGNDTVLFTPTSTFTPTPTSTPTPIPTPTPTPIIFESLENQHSTLSKNEWNDFTELIIGKQVSWKGRILNIRTDQIFIDVGQPKWNLLFSNVPKSQVILVSVPTSSIEKLKIGQEIEFIATISKIDTDWMLRMRIWLKQVSLN